MSDNQRLNRIVCLLLTLMSVRVNIYAQMTETDFVADSISQDESARGNLKPELKQFMSCLIQSKAVVQTGTGSG